MTDRPEGTPGGRVRGIIGKIIYWLAVIALSLTLLVALVLFFESRDDSTLGGAGVLPLDGLHVL